MAARPGRGPPGQRQSGLPDYPLAALRLQLASLADMHAAAGLALFFLPATATAASPPGTSVLSLAEAEALEVKIGADAELARRRLQTGDEGLLPGPDLDAVNDGQDPLNEPCYTHNGQCEGYVVCCVTRGTCRGFGGLISSNAVRPRPRSRQSNLRPRSSS